MGSYGLPALDIKAPQPQEDLLDMYAKAQQIRAMQNNQVLQQQAAQSGQLDIQQKQIQLQNQKALTAAYQNWDPRTGYEGLIGSAQKNGASGDFLMGIQQKMLEQRQAFSKIAADDATTGQKNLETLKSKNDMIAGQIMGHRNVPDDQLPDWIRSTAQNLMKQGVLDPQHEQAAEQLAQLPPAIAHQQLDILAKNYMGANQLMEQGKADADLQLKAAQTKQAAAATEKTQMETDAMKQFGGLPESMIKSKYLQLKALQEQGQKLGEKDAAFVQAYEHEKSINPLVNFRLQNAGATGGANGQPSAIAQGLANGTMKWTDVVSARTPMSVKQQLLAEVKAINPNFNSGDFAVEQKVREKYTSGNVSDQLLAINTAREHMKLFSQLADALNNGDVQLANKIGNAFGVQFGSNRATNFRIAQQALGGEVGRAFDGSGVTKEERDTAMKNYNDAMSRGQFSGAIQTIDALLAGKQRAAQNSYQMGVQGRPNFGDQGTQGAGGANPLDQFWKK